MKLTTHGIVTLSIVLSVGCNFAKNNDASATTVNSGTPGVAAPKGGSCKQPKTGLCTEFASNPFGASEGLCTSIMEGTYAAREGCARENLVGTCQSKANATYYYFANSAGPWPADAKDDCTTIHEGTFTEAAGAAETAKQKALPGADRIAASCSNKDGSCEDILGGGFGASMSKDICQSSDGKWSDGKACSSENVAASCLSKGKVTRYPVGFGGKKGGTSLKDVESFCKGDGLAFSHWYPNAALPALPAKSLAAAKASGSSSKAKK